MPVRATELLKHFRALGGVADNVSIRQGRHGFGLFAVNPRRPVQLLTPAPLLISPQMLVVTPTGQVEVKPDSGLSAEVVAFHTHYQRNFGWGAGGFEYITQYHQQLCALPDRLKSFLQILGCPDDLKQPLTPAQAFKDHCISRQIGVFGASRLMPVMELINYAGDGAPYVVMQDGVSLSGTFKDEVLARYRRSMDAFHFFFNYHFATPGRSTLSCEVTIEIPQFKTLRITRLDGLADLKKGVRWPQVRASKNEIHLSFVELINQDTPALPRQVFTELMSAQGLAASRAHQLFEGLQDHNRQVLQDFLAACEGAQGEVVENLKTVAGYQLSRH